MNDDIRKYRTLIAESYVLTGGPDEIDEMIEAIRRVDEVVPAIAAAAVLPLVAGTAGRVVIQRLFQGAVTNLAPKVGTWLGRSAVAAGAVKGAEVVGKGIAKGASVAGAGAAKGAELVGKGIAKGAGAAGTGAKKIAKKAGKEVIETTVENFLETPAGQKLSNATPDMLQQMVGRVLTDKGLDMGAASGFIDILARSGLFQGGAMGLFVLFLIISHLMKNPQIVKMIASQFGN